MDNNYRRKPLKPEHYWRHKKGVPKEVFPGMNGEVKIVKPAKKSYVKPRKKRKLSEEYINDKIVAEILRKKFQ